VVAVRAEAPAAAGVVDLLAMAFFVRGETIDGGVDGAGTLPLGHVYERAGVHDEHVRFLFMRRHFHAGLAEVADHDFAVDEIFGAAEGNHPDFGFANGGRHGTGASSREWTLRKERLRTLHIGQRGYVAHAFTK
jgi:hypothetical protein